ncbi:MAG: nucleoside recognition domain-containing protein [Methylocystaceae bacterium]
MLNYIWFFLLGFGILVAAVNGNMQAVTDAALSGAKNAVDLCIALIGIMCLWLGIMRIGEKSGLIKGMARILRPLVSRLFPSLPPDSPALGAIIINLLCNILGLGNAATPFGMKAMQEMQDKNPNKNEATEAMCTFLAMNTSCLTLVPATIIGVRVGLGSNNPTEIVGTTIFATAVSMTVAIILDYFFRKHNRRNSQ